MEKYALSKNDIFVNLFCHERILATKMLPHYKLNFAPHLVKDEFNFALRDPFRKLVVRRCKDFESKDSLVASDSSCDKEKSESNGVSLPSSAEAKALASNRLSANDVSNAAAKGAAQGAAKVFANAASQGASKTDIDERVTKQEGSGEEKLNQCEYPYLQDVRFQKRLGALMYCVERDQMSYLKAKVRSDADEFQDGDKKEGSDDHKEFDRFYRYCAEVDLGKRPSDELLEAEQCRILIKASDEVVPAHDGSLMPESEAVALSMMSKDQAEALKSRYEKAETAKGSLLDASMVNTWPHSRTADSLAYLDMSFEDAMHETRLALEEDRIKLTMSSPHRRLQQKTQVFPLNVHTSSRSRLTHSYEVAAYSKLTVSSLCEQIDELKPFMYEMMVEVENASFMHDLGNPPFGHFGEEVIRKWIAEVCMQHEHALTPDLQEDLRVFNGNAQALRLVFSIYRLNLSIGQLASFIKVPYSYNELYNQAQSVGWTRSHSGYFLSEYPAISHIRSSMLGAKRHPLSLIMEQCDDLSYVFADLEDAYDRGVVSNHDIEDLIVSLLKDIGLFDASHSDLSKLGNHQTSYEYENLDSGTISKEHDANAQASVDAAPAKESHAKSGASNAQSKFGANAKSGAHTKAGAPCAHAERVMDAKSYEVDGLIPYNLAMILLESFIYSLKGKVDAQEFNDNVVKQNPMMLEYRLRSVLENQPTFSLLEVLRECITTYYIRDIVDAVARNLDGFIILGELEFCNAYGYQMAHKAVKFIKRWERRHVYSSREVQHLELKGAAYIKGILKVYQDLLDLSYEEFEECKKGKGDAYCRHLYERLPSRYKAAYEDLCDVDGRNISLEMYARIRLLIDYVSSMTDTFAAHEFSIVTGGFAYEDS